MSDVLISKRGRSADVFHTDTECRHLPDRTLSVTLSTAKARGFRKCRECAGEVEPVTENRPALRTLLNRGEVEL